MLLNTTKSSFYFLKNIIFTVQLVKNHLQIVPRSIYLSLIKQRRIVNRSANLVYQMITRYTKEPVVKLSSLLYS